MRAFLFLARLQDECGRPLGRPVAQANEATFQGSPRALTKLCNQSLLNTAIESKFSIVRVREHVKAAAVLTRTPDPCDSEHFDEIRTGEIDWVGIDVGLDDKAKAEK
jgi:hypothetical protein